MSGKTVYRRPDGEDDEDDEVLLPPPQARPVSGIAPAKTKYGSTCTRVQLAAVAILAVGMFTVLVLWMTRVV
jgi:hypothetical protein